MRASAEVTVFTVVARMARFSHWPTLDGGQSTSSEKLSDLLRTMQLTAMPVS